MGVVHLDVHIGGRDEITEEVREVIHHLRPQWEDIDIKALEGGLINQTWLCSNPRASEEKLVLKMFSDATNPMNPFANRKYELMVMIQLAAKGIIKPVVASFKNGIVYEFAEGEILSFEESQKPQARRTLLRRIYEIHQQKVPYKGQGHNLKEESYFYECITNILPKLPDVVEISEDANGHEKLTVSKKELLLMSKSVLPYFDDLLLRHPIVFCHLDLNESNIVYDAKADVMWPLDWELCGYSIAPAELARSIEHWFGEEPTEEQEQALIRDYLDQHPDTPAVSQEVIDIWYHDFIMASMLLMLNYVIWTAWILAYCELGSERKPIIKILLRKILLKLKERQVALAQKE